MIKNRFKSQRIIEDQKRQLKKAIYLKILF